MPDDYNPDDYNPDDFHIDYPVWVIFDAATITATGEPRLTGLPVFAPQGAIDFIPMFTDWDLAFRFLVTMQGRYCALPYGRAKLEALLAELVRGSVPNIGFDVGGNRVARATVAQVLAGVRGEG